VDGLVRQGIRSLLLTRNEAIEGTSWAVAGETCRSKDGVKEPPADEIEPAGLHSAAFEDSTVFNRRSDPPSYPTRHAKDRMFRNSIGQDFLVLIGINGHGSGDANIE
jgi:hypothetical protein